MRPIHEFSNEELKQYFKSATPEEREEILKQAVSRADENPEIEKRLRTEENDYYWSHDVSLKLIKSMDHIVSEASGPEHPIDLEIMAKTLGLAIATFGHGFLEQLLTTETDPVERYKTTLEFVDRLVVSLSILKMSDKEREKILKIIREKK